METLKDVIEEDIKLSQNRHNLEESNSFRKNLNRENKSLYRSMKLFKISVNTVEFFRLFGIEQQLDAVPDIDTH